VTGSPQSRRQISPVENARFWLSTLSPVLMGCVAPPNGLFAPLVAANVHQNANEPCFFICSAGRATQVRRPPAWLPPSQQTQRASDSRRTGLSCERVCTAGRQYRTGVAALLASAKDEPRCHACAEVGDPAVARRHVQSKTAFPINCAGCTSGEAATFRGGRHRAPTWQSRSRDAPRLGHGGASTRLPGHRAVPHGGARRAPRSL
jgi:hypothetical protein